METHLDEYKKNMKVYIQILPPQNSCWDNIKISDDKKTIFVRCLQDFSKGAKPANPPNYWKFQTDGVLNTMNQEDIFNTHIKPSLKYAFMGVDVLIIAYGQTGSGKSTTINGLLNNFDNRGITPRIISEIFTLKDEFKYESKSKFQISFVEIFKTHIIDLINYRNGYKIQSPFKNIHMQKIESETEGWKYLFQGEGRRKLKQFNEYYSNLSTSICTIFVKSVSKVISNPVEKYAKIHIIDMSGIDTYGNLSCQSKHPRDIGFANLNKIMLQRCLIGIQEEILKGKHSSKGSEPFIRYLGDSLSAQSFTIFLGHIKSNREDLCITLSALQFANTAKKVVKTKLKTTVVASVPLSVKDLQNKLDALQEQIYLNSMLKNNNLSFNLTQNRVEQIQHAINEYIQDKANEISVLNVTDAVIALNIFKEICSKLEAEKQEVLEKMEILNSKNVNASFGRISGTFTNKMTDTKTSLKSFRRSSKDINKKIMASDIASRVSRQSYKSSATNREGSLSKTGSALGHLLSSNYQGDATKSLILKTKLLSSDLNSKQSYEIYCSLSDLNLSDIEISCIETIWNTYKIDSNYNFEKNNSVLEILINSSKNLLNQYNILIDALNKKIELIDLKKYDLLKLTLYEGVTSLQCAEVFDEEKSLNVTKERLTNNIAELLKDSIQIKEEILTLLADLKILVQEYHRNKKQLTQDFAQYCINNFQVRIPCDDKSLENIEDDLAAFVPKMVKISGVSNSLKDLFIKYQNTLKKNRLVNNDLI